MQRLRAAIAWRYGRFSTAGHFEKLAAEIADAWIGVVQVRSFASLPPPHAARWWGNVLTFGKEA
jgi:hypothetical protein